MPTIAELINLHNAKSIHLGVLMELYMSDRVPLGPIPQHPEVHVSDGFELDPDKILTAPHRTVKYQLQEELAKKAGSDQLAVEKLKKAIVDAEASNKASMPLIQRKQDAWGPDAHLLPTTYGAFPQSLTTSGAALQKTDDSGPAFDISRLSDSERQLKLRQAQADIVKLQGAYDLLPQNKKKKVLPGPTGRDSKVFKEYVAAESLIKQLTSKANVNSAGMTYVSRGPDNKLQPEHSMFNDGETALMALYAVLTTAAARFALEKLNAMVVEDFGVTIHSYSAPKYMVSRPTAVAGTPSTHARRNDPIQARVREGNKDGSLLKTSFVNIKYVTTCLARKGTEVILITHYPVADGRADELAPGYIAGMADVVVETTGMGVQPRTGFVLETPTGNWLQDAP